MAQEFGSCSWQLEACDEPYHYVDDEQNESLNYDGKYFMVSYVRGGRSYTWDIPCNAFLDDIDDDDIFGEPDNYPLEYPDNIQPVGTVQTLEEPTVNNDHVIEQDCSVTEAYQRENANILANHKFNIWLTTIRSRVSEFTQQQDFA